MGFDAMRERFEAEWPGSAQLYLPGGPINEAYATDREYAGDKAPAK